jgi:hypothetical protein
MHECEIWTEGWKKILRNRLHKIQRRLGAGATRATRLFLGIIFYQGSSMQFTVI